jgi:hypothetical protein
MAWKDAPAKHHTGKGAGKPEHPNKGTRGTTIHGSNEEDGEQGVTARKRGQFLQQIWFSMIVVGNNIRIEMFVSKSQVRKNQGGFSHLLFCSGEARG